MNLKSPTSYLPNLTGLRFFLALFVVIFHTHLFSINQNFPLIVDIPLLHKGTEAVYVFFTLSGFLIIKQLFQEKKKTASINLKRFYSKRALRIFPVYYLVVVIGFLYYRVILPSLGYEVNNDYPLINGILLSCTFFANIFKTYDPGGILEVLWSIGIEEQFYFFIAPVLLLIPIRKITPFLILFTILYLGLFSIENMEFLRDYGMFFFYFSFGGVCAISLENKHLLKFLKKIKLITILIFLLYFFSDFFERNLTLAFYDLFSMVLFGLTIKTLSLSSLYLFENRLINYLGEISYGIYMYHCIIIQLAGLIYIKIISKLNFHPMLDIIFIYTFVFLISILVSHLSYKYYESFFLKLKNKLN